MKDMLIELLKIRSNPHNEREVADYILHKISSMGYDCYEDASKIYTGSNTGNIVVMNNYNSNNKKLTFCAHMDTIEIDFPPRFKMEGDKIVSTGNTAIGIDDKAGIVAMLKVLELFKDKKEILDNVYFLFTTCEEEEFKGAKSVYSCILEDSFIYVLDSGKGPIGRVVNQAGGQASFYIDFYGVEAHASSSNGVNAVYTASKFVSNLKLGKVTEDITINISKFNGGLTTNTTPSVGRVKGEILFWKEEALKKTVEHMKAVLNKIVEKYDGSYNFMYNIDCNKLDVKEDDEIVNFSKKAAIKSDLAFSLGKSGGGSDAHVFNDRGFKAVKLSIGMENVHTRKEEVHISSINDTVKYMVSLINSRK